DGLIALVERREARIIERRGARLSPRLRQRVRALDLEVVEARLDDEVDARVLRRRAGVEAVLDDAGRDAVDEADGPSARRVHDRVDLGSLELVANVAIRVVDSSEQPFRDLASPRDQDLVGARGLAIETQTSALRAARRLEELEAACGGVVLLDRRDGSSRRV